MLTIQHTRDDFARRPPRTAVLPVGAVEQHGRHLPVGTDVLLAEAMARQVAEALDAYLLPPVAIASSIEHRKAKGTVYLRSDTLGLVVRDIADSLRESGFRRLVLVNFHGGNWVLKPTIRQINRDHPGFRAYLTSPDLPPARAAEIFEHPSGDIHAGEIETSLMLHLYPQWVRRVRAKSPRAFPPQAFIDYFDTTDLSEAGHWGWPEKASAEKGCLALQALVGEALRLVREVDRMAARLSRRR